MFSHTVANGPKSKIKSMIRRHCSPPGGTGAKSSAFNYILCLLATIFNILIDVLGS